MVLRPFWGKLIVIGFMILVGFSLARAVYYSSVMGILLSLVSLGAVFYFVKTATRVREEWESEESA